MPGPEKGKRTLLNFEAVDHETNAWVNGHEVGSHAGGFTPFSFYITSALKPEGNELIVRVHDATEGFQLHGKQKLQPGGINIASGGNFWPVGEFGGHGMPIEGHLWSKTAPN